MVQPLLFYTELGSQDELALAGTVIALPLDFMAEKRFYCTPVLFLCVKKMLIKLQWRQNSCTATLNT